MNRSLADTTLTGLPPLADSGARVLLLGSMPGAVSLHQQQYYAHPRNLFWPIMANLAGFNADLPYTEKTQALINSGAALWDVIGSCQRSGSLDSAIRDEQVNDFAGFFRCHPELAAIGFNGAKAWQSFKRYVLPLQIPAYRGAMIGHLKRQFILPVGAKVRLDATAGTLQLLEPVFAG